MTEKEMWVYNSETQLMEYKKIHMVPGLYKIFDEILVNAADNKIRDPSMDTLKVTIDRATNTISVYNNGRGIPVEIHEVCQTYNFLQVTKPSLTELYRKKKSMSPR